jgi:hypothetical protein
VEDADADEAEVILAVMAVEVTTVAEARELLSTTIRRLHHHYACCETTLAITCGVSPCIIFGSIFKQDPQRDTGDLLILKTDYEANHQADPQARNLLCRTTI